MSAGDLIFNSITICDVGAGDVYSRVGNNVPHLVTADIAFPNTAGRELRVTGRQNSGESAFGVVYGQSGRNVSVIYKATGTAMASFLYGTTNSIKAILGGTTQISTLTDRESTYTGMRMDYFKTLSPVQRVQIGTADRVCLLFEAGFSRYTV